MSFDSFYKDLRKSFQSRLWLTSLMAAGVSACTVGLLGLSGWFLTGAAVAGAGGPIAAQAFNYLLPSALIRALAIARTTFRYAERYLGHSAALRAMATLRPALFARIVQSSPDATLRLSRGEASSRFIQDVATLENALVMQSAPASAMGGIIITLLCCVLANPLAALIVLVLMGAALLAGQGLIRLHKDNGDEQAAIGALKSRFHEVMSIVPDVRAYDLHGPLMAEFARLEDGLKAAKLGNSHTDALVQAAMLVFSGVALCAVASLTLAAGLPAMALALLATSAGFESLGGLVRALTQAPATAAATARVAEVFDLPKSNAMPTMPTFVHDGQTFPIDGHLRLRIDGPSGSGKTRMIETLLGLRGQSRGMTGGTAMFSLCPQDAGLVTGTIRDNLAMATPEKIDDAQAWAALEDAMLSDRVRALPKSLETWIGDGGVTLSGGERKRLALARAYLRPALALVLDEPTEGLDLKTEEVVVDRLIKRLKREGQGLILISHREGPRRLASNVLKLTAP